MQISEQQLKPLVNIGKSGLSEGIVEEIRKHLKKKKVIKIKCLRYFLESIDEKNNKEKMKAIAQLLAKALPAKINTIKGFTITFEKAENKKD